MSARSKQQYHSYLQTSMMSYITHIFRKIKKTIDSIDRRYISSQNQSNFTNCYTYAEFTNECGVVPKLYKEEFFVESQPLIGKDIEEGIQDSNVVCDTLNINKLNLEDFTTDLENTEFYEGTMYKSVSCDNNPEGISQNKIQEHTLEEKVIKKKKRKSNRGKREKELKRDKEEEDRENASNLTYYKLGENGKPLYIKMNEISIRNKI